MGMAHCLSGCLPNGSHNDPTPYINPDCTIHNPNAQRLLFPADEAVRPAVRCTCGARSLVLGNHTPPCPYAPKDQQTYAESAGMAWHGDTSITTGNAEGEKNVEHPPHYNRHPSGVECIDVVQHMNFNVGNAMKYLWRSDHKHGLEDLKKAAWYIAREIERLGQG